ncbi:MAG TPA: glutaminase [Microbacterium sp.]|uniref:glutaminase n=1 Tax=Microbacterium sp. TaxID=51671 RepID=UPI002B4A7980|nr:glutaminase [Microbacterium sp.]HKT55174.1 glutaminase [Microbacterium sp.]
MSARADAALAALVDDVRTRLAGAPTERLGVVRAAGRVLGFPRAERIVPGDAVWHLGAMLVRCDGPAVEGLLATGEILRARAEVRRGFTAESQRARAARAAAARRGGFDEGETAHVDAVPIDAGALVASGVSGPVSVAPDGTLLIRWSRAGAPVPLGPYLDERIDLLQHPAPGA